MRVWLPIIGMGLVVAASGCARGSGTHAEAVASHGPGGLVFAPVALSEDAAISSRSDHLMGADRRGVPGDFQVTETYGRQRLRITNGRSRENTTVTTFTYRRRTR